MESGKTRPVKGENSKFSMFQKEWHELKLFVSFFYVSCFLISSSGELD